MSGWAIVGDDRVLSRVDGRSWPLVVIEGGDGAGTTTQAQLLGNRLRERAERCLVTALPSRGPIGQILRRMLRGEHGPWPWQAQLHLFQADRLIHVAEEVLPALEQGAVVLDRYTYSTAVYQGVGALRAGARLDCHGVWDAARWAEAILGDAEDEPGWVQPDLAILLDVDGDTAAARRGLRGGLPEVFDGATYQAAVLETYRALWDQLRRRECSGSRYVVVDGTQGAAAVAEAIWAEVAPLVD